MFSDDLSLFCLHVIKPNNFMEVEDVFKGGC